MGLKDKITKKMAEQLSKALQVKETLEDVEPIDMILPPGLEIDFSKIFGGRPILKVGDWVIDESNEIGEIVQIEQGPFYIAANVEMRNILRQYQRKHITKVPKGDPKTIRILYGKD